jgi:L-aspartate oxidase
MQSDVAMSRTDAGLAEAAESLGGLLGELPPCPASPPALELANLATVASLVAHSAWLRAESRGCHSRLDFPERDDEHWRVRIIMRRGVTPRLGAIDVGPVPLGHTSGKQLEFTD